MRTAFLAFLGERQNRHILLTIDETVRLLMSIDVPEVGEQDASPLVDRKGLDRLATFVLELWAQRHSAAQARRHIEKKLADDTQLLN